MVLGENLQNSVIYDNLPIYESPFSSDRAFNAGANSVLKILEIPRMRNCFLPKFCFIVKQFYKMGKKFIKMLLDYAAYYVKISQLLNKPDQ